jgi:hypothetical protein
MKTSGDRARVSLSYKAKLIAASLNHNEYLTLHNTVRAVRGSGAPLDPEQEQKVKEFEAVVAAYQEAHPC